MHTSQLLDSIGRNVSIAPIAEAIDAAEAVLFAIPGTVIEETIKGLENALDDKIVIDATNKVGQAEMNSLGAISVEAPQAKLFRAFNSLGWENFDTPSLGNMQIDLFYCGHTGDAQKTVHQLIADIGLRPVYVGDLSKLEVVDALTKLWFALVFEQGHDRRLAFKLLTE